MSVKPLFVLTILIGIFSFTTGCVSLTEREKSLEAQLGQKDITPASAEERKAVERKDVFIQAAFWAEELDKNPSDKEAALKLTYLLRKVGKPENAMTTADQALTLHPQDEPLMIAFALAAIEIGKPGNALKALERLLQSDSTNKQGLTLSAICYDQLKDYKRSDQFYQKALQLYPDDSFLLTNRGYSAILSGHPDRAEAWLKKAVVQTNPRPEARQNLALALGLQGKYKEAKFWALKDLPETEVNQNIAYLKSLTNYPDQVQIEKSAKTIFKPQSSPSRSNKQAVSSKKKSIEKKTSSKKDADTLHSPSLKLRRSF